MPFNAVPVDDFLNRESELSYLKGLAGLKGNALGGNVFLAGARGIGKTELLKQLHLSLFREGNVAPFYYSFRTASLKGAYFAKDYFSAFVRQYVSAAKKDPAIVEDVAEPIEHLIPAISALGLHWLIDSIDDFQEHARKNDFYWQVVAAVSAPSLAAKKGGKPVTVMLDDFDGAENLYESSKGDSHGLISIFGEAMASSLCPHIFAGVAGALENIVTNHSFMGMAERMRLGPLPEDMAAALFRSHAANLKIILAPEMPLDFLATLRGNPLYIRNLAKAAWKMGKRELAEKDLIECYSFEVSEGETAFYWSSLFNGCVKNWSKRRIVLKALVDSLENGGIEDENGRPVAAGSYDEDTGAALEALRAAGINPRGDRVLQDFIRCLYMREIEGGKSRYAREKIEAQYSGERVESCFEMVIPMSANAELVVAKAVEQIGRNIELEDEFLNYLQLALIEVCINAIEHSGSYEKKVYLKICTRPDKLEIIVENSGRYFSLDGRVEVPVEDKLRLGMRRGWGFKLVYSIMDSVKVERAGDRTRVILTKNIKSKEDV